MESLTINFLITYLLNFANEVFYFHYKIVELSSIALKNNYLAFPIVNLKVVFGKKTKTKLKKTRHFEKF